MRKMEVEDGQWQHDGAVGTICGPLAPSCGRCGHCLGRSPAEAKVASAAILRFCIVAFPKGHNYLSSRMQEMAACASALLLRRRLCGGCPLEYSRAYTHMQTCRSLNLKHALLHYPGINTHSTIQICVFCFCSACLHKFEGNIGPLFFSFPS